MRRILTRTGLALLIFAACLMAFPGSSVAEDLPGKGKKVEPGAATWTTGFFLEALYSRACEELGYDVEEAKKLGAPIFYRSLAEGDLDLDIFNARPE